MPVDVNAQGLKQVAFLQEEDVEGELVYDAACSGWEWGNTDPVAAGMRIETVNDEEHGLGVALPSGSVAVFERGPLGEMLVAEDSLRDYASGQDVDIRLGPSAQVFSSCRAVDGVDPREGKGGWARMETTLSNANPNPVTVRLYLGFPAQWHFSGAGEGMDEGQRIVEATVPANGTRTVAWRVRPVTE